jgi:hypothetical protein
MSTDGFDRFRQYYISGDQIWPIPRRHPAPILGVGRSHRALTGAVV